MMAGFENDLLFGSNADFSGATNPAEANGLQTDNQVWLGSTAVNAGGTHIDVKTLAAGNNMSLVRSAGALTFNSNPTPESLPFLIDDMHYGYNTNPVASTVLGPWFIWISGTGICDPQSGTAVGHPGVLRLSTGGGSTGKSLITTGATTNRGDIWVGGGQITLTFYFNLNQLSNGTDRFSIYLGLANDIQSPPGNNGIWLGYTDNVNSGQWTINTRSGGGAITTTNTSVAVATGWQVVQLVINAAGTSVQFFAGTTLANLASLGTLSATIPTSLGLGIDAAIIKSAGSTPCTLDMDLITFYQTLTTSR